MPDDDADSHPPLQDSSTTRPTDSTRSASSTTSTTTTTNSRSWYALPPPLKRIFDRFPLVTYDANELPLRARSSNRNANVLHVFTTKEDAVKGKPSFNPGCLRWQTYLKFAGVQFETVVSSNHASPSGALPFLQPAGSDPQAMSTVDPVPSNRLKRWLGSRNIKVEETSDVRYEAYTSLLEHRVRKAWLAQLYLRPENTALVEDLYVNPCSSHPLVQTAVIRHLRSAAEAELIKSAGTSTLSAEDLEREAGEAFEALSALLGDDEWFFGQVKPGMLDASLFAYTHLILDKSLPWKVNPLREGVARLRNLVRHRERVLEMYY